MQTKHQVFLIPQVMQLQITRKKSDSIISSFNSFTQNFILPFEHILSAIFIFNVICIFIIISVFQRRYSFFIYERKERGNNFFHHTYFSSNSFYNNIYYNYFHCIHYIHIYRYRYMW